MMGETAENLASSLDSYSYKQPLGVCAGICPFNFPAMIPLWMFPVGVVTGNTYVLKPSEKDPGASMVWVSMFMVVLYPCLTDCDLICLDPRPSGQGGWSARWCAQHHSRRSCTIANCIPRICACTNNMICCPIAGCC